MDNSLFDYSYHYRNWHSDTKESRDFDMENARRFFCDHCIFPQRKGAKILEIGCGMGRVLLMLKAAGYSDLTGVDIDKSQVEIARKSGLTVDLSDALAYLEKSSGKFDAIYFFDFIEHIEKEKQLDFLCLVKEHLREDGIAAFAVPNALAPCGMFFRYIDFTHTICYTRESISFLLHNAGLHHIQIRPQHTESVEIQKLKVPWAKLYRNEFGLRDVILTPNLVVVAFKEKACMDNYLKRAPNISNSYEENSRLKSKFWRYIKPLKFR